MTQTEAPRQPPEPTRSASAPDRKPPSPPSSPREVSQRAVAREQSPPARVKETRMNRIAQRAHEIYEARGGEHGKALDDWLEAERQIDAEIEQEAQGA